jgi:hypothetical protein
MQYNFSFINRFDIPSQTFKEDVMSSIAQRSFNSIEDLRQIEPSLKRIATNRPKGLILFQSFWAITTQHIHRYTHSPFRRDIPMRKTFTDEYLHGKELAQ